ncbi:hypothetical protein IU449_00110 [Nocardia higoensis]|uniref:Uncharacterized protein n=1 Tax=Nocardia higoensis TaxID=228599 RepID=A0ABS0D804_9NOCA|nr:hypothetical protein [Nocardia higoensis]MBF6352964.1 hypothetical protein [Nocardia higoensis]
MKRHNTFCTDRQDHTPYRDNVVDLFAHRRGLLERRGLDPDEIAARLCAETGVLAKWDNGNDGDGGYAA